MCLLFMLFMLFILFIRVVDIDLGEEEIFRFGNYRYGINFEVFIEILIKFFIFWNK